VSIKLTHSDHFAGACHIVVKHEVILDTAFAQVLSLKQNPIKARRLELANKPISVPDP
jgi:hypothetical protein